MPQPDSLNLEKNFLHLNIVSSAHLTAGVANTFADLFDESTSATDDPTSMASVSWTSTSDEDGAEAPPSPPDPDNSMSTNASPVWATLSFFGKKRLLIAWPWVSLLRIVDYFLVSLNLKIFMCFSYFEKSTQVLRFQKKYLLNVKM